MTTQLLIYADTEMTMLSDPIFDFLSDGEIDVYYKILFEKYIKEQHVSICQQYILVVYQYECVLMCLHDMAGPFVH